MADAAPPRSGGVKAALREERDLKSKGKRQTVDGPKAKKGKPVPPPMKADPKKPAPPAPPKKKGKKRA